MQSGNPKTEIKDTITNLGIEYRLLTQFTSFVAVEERVVTDGGQPRKIEVPVELPEGVSREGIFGDDEESVKIMNYAVAPGIIGGAIMSPKQIQNLPINGRGTGYGSGSGRGDGKPRKVKREVDKVYKEWNEKDVAYIISNEEKQAFNQPIKATNLPKPIYPKTAKTNGAVNVEVIFDKDGKVVSAKSISGDKAFYEAAETSARNAKFDIPKIAFEIKQIKGILEYNFAAKTRTATVSENLQNAEIEIKPNKYHSSVKALVERLKTGAAANANESKFVRENRADLIVRVRELKPETIEQLKKLGFTVLAEMSSAKAIVGSIAVEKISALAEIEAVTFISPQNR